MLLITGQYDRAITREAGNPGRTWTETTMVILDFGVTYYVKAGRDFGDLPAEGTTIAVDVTVRAYPKKAGDGAGFEYIGLRRNADAERALAPVAAK
jgi:hypothetical protein